MAVGIENIESRAFQRAVGNLGAPDASDRIEAMMRFDPDTILALVGLPLPVELARHKPLTVLSLPHRRVSETWIGR